MLARAWRRSLQRRRAWPLLAALLALGAMLGAMRLLVSSHGLAGLLAREPVPEFAAALLDSAHPAGAARRWSPRRVFDGFVFNFELDVLELRLETLAPVVDAFILVEAPVTFQNTSKPLHFAENKHRFSRFLPQIVHVVVDSLPAVFEYWENEVHFRDAIGTLGLARVLPPPSDDDVVMVFDVDEIPRPELVWLLKHFDLPVPVVKVSLRWTYYGFAWENVRPLLLNVAAPVWLLRQHGNRTNELRRVALGAQQWQVGSGALPAGWHCSWCFPVALFPAKLASFSHSELNTPRNRDIDRLERMVGEGVWFGSGRREGVLSSPETLPTGQFAPPYAIAHPERFGYLLAPK